MAYTIINFLISIPPEGQPYFENGKYVLKQHGHVIREITQAQYISGKANLLRAFSGHWMLFYYVPMIYFLKRTDDSQRSYL